MKLFKEGYEEDSFPKEGKIDFYSNELVRDFKKTLDWLEDPEKGFSKLNLETTFLLANEVLDEIP